jgi:hypothetical protein
MQSAMLVIKSVLEQQRKLRVGLIILVKGRVIEHCIRTFLLSDIDPTEMTFNNVTSPTTKGHRLRRTLRGGTRQLRRVAERKNTSLI